LVIGYSLFVIRRQAAKKRHTLGNAKPWHELPTIKWIAAIHFYGSSPDWLTLRSEKEVYHSAAQ
jgi:hypothetical protein